MDDHSCLDILDTPTIAASEAMRGVFRTAERAARLRAAVLVTGETGTGKEHVGRAIHHFSLQCGGPWVDVNCAAIPEHLMESELFGYEKGAFSGAKEHLVQNGQFRRDLYYRLSQITIRVPPLRERKDDIIPLAELFLDQVSPAGTRVTASALSLLVKQEWAGNARELRNAVIGALLEAEEDVIDRCHILPPKNASHVATPETAGMCGSSPTALAVVGAHVDPGSTSSRRGESEEGGGGAWDLASDPVPKTQAIPEWRTK